MCIRDRPNSEDCVAWNASLGTFPGSVLGRLLNTVAALAAVAEQTETASAATVAAKSLPVLGMRRPTMSRLIPWFGREIERRSLPDQWDRATP